MNGKVVVRLGGGDGPKVILDEHLGPIARSQRVRTIINWIRSFTGDDLTELCADNQAAITGWGRVVAAHVHFLARGAKAFITAMKGGIGKGKHAYTYVPSMATLQAFTGPYIVAKLHAMSGPNRPRHVYCLCLTMSSARVMIFVDKVKGCWVTHIRDLDHPLADGLKQVQALFLISAVKHDF